MFVHFLILVMSDGPLKARRPRETVHEQHSPVLTEKDRAALKFPETKLQSQFKILWFQSKFCIPASWVLWLPWGESRAPGWGVMNRDSRYLTGNVSPANPPCGCKAWPSASLSCFGGAWKLFCIGFSPLPGLDSPAPLNLVALFPLDHFPEKSC